MGWNGSGSITLLYDWTADRDAGIPDAYISADKFDPYMEDIAGAIENTLARDGQNRPAANLNWDTYRIENLGAPTGPLHAVNANSVSLSLFGGTTTGGAANYTISATYLSSVGTGTMVRMIANHTNTGAATLTISGGVLGSTAIVRADGSSALTGGEIVSGDFFEVAYDGTSWVLIHTPVEQTGDFVDGTVTAGVNDSRAGTFIAYGGADTQVGGAVLLYNANDTDTTHDYWGIGSAATTGNLELYRFGATNADMYIANADGYIELGRDSGLVGIGRSDAQSGTLRLYGGATGSSQGGELQIYNDDSNDGTVDYYRVEALTGNLVIARGTGTADVTINTDGEATFSADVTFSASVIGHPAMLTPGGRLTHTSGNPTDTGANMIATAIYYAPYNHDIIQIYNGTDWVTHRFTQLTNTFTDATKNPAAVSGPGMYDLFVWDDSGTLRLSRGPKWTDTSTRSLTITRVNGIQTNTSAITNGPSANQGTWVGCFYANASNQMPYRISTNTATSADVRIWFGYWNRYNRVRRGFYASYGAGSYTYATNTYRYVRNDGNYNIAVAHGTGGSINVVNESVNSHNLAASGARGALNWGVDGTTAALAQRFHDDMSVTEVSCTVCGGTLYFGAGLHVIHPLETAPTSQTFTGYTADSNLNGEYEY